MGLREWCEHSLVTLAMVEEGMAWAELLVTLALVD